MELSLWENIFLALMVLAILVWMRPSKALFQQSKNSPSDWLGVLIPLISVVLFVIFLISIV